MAFIQLVTFELSGEEYGMEIDSINGIIKSKSYKIFKIPNSPKHLEGIINLRGKVNPVFNLKKKFQLEDESISPESKIIIVNTSKDTTVGFIVDEVTDIYKIEDTQIEDAPKGINNYITGIGKVDDKIVMIFDLVKVLSEDDMMKVQSISTQNSN
ncbi:MAG TPA: chemotaxis protein CheW [Ruminiclostridium sp.]|nr:chemotaxis protein CheW [Ruminiclostridium sp.]